MDDNRYKHPCFFIRVIEMNGSRDLFFHREYEIVRETYNWYISVYPKHNILMMSCRQ